MKNILEQQKQLKELWEKVGEVGFVKAVESIDNLFCEYDFRFYDRFCNKARQKVNYLLDFGEVKARLEGFLIFTRKNKKWGVSYKFNLREVNNALGFGILKDDEYYLKLNDKTRCAAIVNFEKLIEHCEICFQMARSNNFKKY